MIDQEQTRKFWAGWVRRQIGGNEMVQEAAVSAAVNEIVQGRDNQAAADAARRIAQSLGVNVSSSTSAPVISSPTPSSTRNVALPVTPTGAVASGKDGQPLRCRLCGSIPAANMTIHEHNGRLIWMVHKTNPGPFCRDCGTALLRHHQNSTLFQGWFGLFSFFITPVTLLLNLNSWRKVKALGPPQRDPNVQSRIPAPLNPGKPLLSRPGPYIGGVVVAAAACLLIINGMDTGGCLDSSVKLGNRMTSLHNAFVETYNRDTKAIKACQSVDCERAPKLEIASSLRSYNEGLNKICWPNKYTSDEASLVMANGAMADAYTRWASATTPAEDQALAADAKTADERQSQADDTLANDLGVPPASASSS